MTPSYNKMLIVCVIGVYAANIVYAYVQDGMLHTNSYLSVKWVTNRTRYLRILMSCALTLIEINGGEAS